MDKEFQIEGFVCGIEGSLQGFWHGETIFTKKKHDYTTISSEIPKCSKKLIPYGYFETNGRFRLLFFSACPIQET